LTSFLPQELVFFGDLSSKGRESDEKGREAAVANTMSAQPFQEGRVRIRLVVRVKVRVARAHKVGAPGVGVAAAAQAIAPRKPTAEAA
jgi:hypothetical protein